MFTELKNLWPLCYLCDLKVIVMVIVEGASRLFPSHRTPYTIIPGKNRRESSGKYLMPQICPPAIENHNLPSYSHYSHTIVSKTLARRPIPSAPLQKPPVFCYSSVLLLTMKFDESISKLLRPVLLNFSNSFGLL